MLNFKLISILGLLGLVACSSPEIAPQTETKDQAPPAEVSSIQAPLSPRAAVLTREAALARYKQITKVSYRLWFNLDAENLSFQGRTQVQFDLKPKAKEAGKKIFLDFEGGTLNSVLLNGTPLNDLKDPKRYNGFKIYFDLSELRSGGNQIEIAYSHPYSTDGNGLHRFKDPADQQVYLYSDFEPYRAHRMFPCFDQPDLKATYELTVVAPAEWQVISNTLEKSTHSSNARKTWNFPVSPVFSTYLFALHAGPYAVWKSSADKIPIRLFSRKSLAKYVDHQEWLKITQQGLDFFGTEFGFPYPFYKYDQVIVPDFNAGAMENVGAVTFSERTIYRTKVTQDRHRRRADTILHEMAHMWFGNLVTMRWWNGLWLNESFATLLAATAVEKATEFGGSWQAFFSDMKKWAYWEDQLVTTHPIELPVPDTDSAEANFDGITYGKGAATLKQLRFYLGEDDFREGLQRYFQKYAFRNTTISDFMKMLEEASSEDLGRWQKTWLQTAGVNTIRADWKCEINPKSGQSLISQFDLIQLPANASNEIRPHRTQIALYDLHKGHGKTATPLTPANITEFAYSSASNPVRELIGEPCPDLVFPNTGDYDYVKVELDPVTLKQVYHSLARISDPLTRQMLWHTLWEMVIDGKIRAQDFANTAISQGKNEKDTLVLSGILGPITENSAGSDSVIKFLTGKTRVQYQKKIESWLKHQLLLAPAHSDQQLIWYRSLLNVASQPDTLHFLQNLLNKRQKLPGFVVDQEHRWEIIEALARNGVSNASELIAQDLKNDQTDMGEKAAIRAEAAIPDPILKSKWLNQVTLKEGQLPLAKLREAMSTYHQLGQEEYTQKSVETYFEVLPTLALSDNPRTVEYAKWFVNQMYPSLCDSKLIEKTDALLKAHPEMPAPIIKDLKIHKQEEERCIRARAKAQEPGTS